MPYPKILNSGARISASTGSATARVQLRCMEIITALCFWGEKMTFGGGCLIVSNQKLFLDVGQRPRYLKLNLLSLSQNFKGPGPWGCTYPTCVTSYLSNLHVPCQCKPCKPVPGHKRQSKNGIIANKPAELAQGFKRDN